MDPAPLESRLQECIAAYLQELEAGRVPERAAWLTRYTDVADGLRAFFADHDRMTQAAAPVRAALREDPSEHSATETFPQAFGDYELLEEIGRGGMGIVYKARHTSLNRVVALKRIRAGQLAAPEEVARFRREAAAAAGLDHPHIVPILEVGAHAGQHFFTMKLIEGGNLGGQLDKFADAKVTAELMIKIARAVNHAHQRGILHRDLKPSNILIDAAGNPHVSDFGLAQPIEKEAKLTQSGAIVGTAEYMAPEQARGEKGLTTAADVYGLGAILYVLLAGRPPFQGDYNWETLKKVVEEDPPSPRALNCKANRDLETICLKCLAKQPAGRYGSAEALAEELECWLAHKPIRARRARAIEHVWKWARRRPARAALLVAVVTVVVLGVGVFLQQREISRAQTLAMAQQAEIDAQANLATAQDQLAREKEWFLVLEQARNDHSQGNRSAALRHLKKLVDMRKDWPEVGDAAVLNDEAFKTVIAPGVRLLREISVGGSEGKGHIDMIKYTRDLRSHEIRFNADGSLLRMEIESQGVWIYPVPDGAPTNLKDQLLRNVDPVKPPVADPLLKRPPHLKNEPLAYNPDGRTALFAHRKPAQEGGQDTLEFWDLLEGKLLASVPDDCARDSIDHPRLLSADGRWCVYESRAEPGKVWVLDRVNPQKPFALGSGRDHLTPIAINPAHPLVAVWRDYDCRKVELWDLETRKLAVAVDNDHFLKRVVTLQSQFLPKNAVVWSPDSSRFLTKAGRATDRSYTDNGDIRIWELCFGNPTFFLGKSANMLFESPNPLVHSLEFAPDSSKLSVNADVWEVRGAKQGVSLRRPFDTTDAPLTLYGTAGRVWQAYIPQPIYRGALDWQSLVKGSNEPIRIVQVAPRRGEWVLPRPVFKVTKSWDARRWPWDREPWSPWIYWERVDQPLAVSCYVTGLAGNLAPMPTGNCLASMLSPFLTEVAAMTTMDQGPFSVQRFGISPDGRFACVLFEAAPTYPKEANYPKHEIHPKLEGPLKVSQLDVWSLEREQASRVWTLPYQDANCRIPFYEYCRVHAAWGNEQLGPTIPPRVLFHADQKHFKLSKRPVYNTLHVPINLDTVYSLSAPPGGKKAAAAMPVFTAEYHPLFKTPKKGNHDELLAAIPASQIAEVKGQEGKLIKLAAYHLKELPRGAVDGVAGQEQFVHLMDLATGRTLLRWRAHDHGVTALALSPDGKTLATAGREGTLTTWNTLKLWDLDYIRQELNALGLGWRRS